MRRTISSKTLRMHYVEEGRGDPVLLLHGEPSWAFRYRKMIPPLVRVARVVAPDYFGFGRSDKPTRIEDYSYDFHYASIERFADELDPRDTTVVVQDWGGPIGLRLAVERPERVVRLVILNTGIGALAFPLGPGGAATMCGSVCGSLHAAFRPREAGSRRVTCGWCGTHAHEHVEHLPIVPSTSAGKALAGVRTVEF